MNINDKSFYDRAWQIPIAWIVCAGFANVLRADEPVEYLTRASCASATCHGGIQGQGPAWNSSLRNWEANDLYHAGAGQVLMNEHSKRMVASLARGSKRDDGATGEALHQIILQERCIGCHAPSLAFADPTQDRSRWLEGIRDGVSCEACHGPAAGWLKLHTLIEPEQEKLAASGKLATEPWPKRTDNCLRCHVGSRTQDGIIRDMNHDMIAAGHPALKFDMSESQLRLPAHWDVSAPKRLRAYVRFAAIEPADRVPSQRPIDFELATPGEHIHAKGRALAAVARLSLERLAASRAGHTPWPELAEFNCYACHQSIGSPTASDGRASQNLTWNTFYTQHTWTGLDLVPRGTRRKAMDIHVAAAELTDLLKSAEAQRFEPMAVFTALRLASDLSMLQQAKSDWQLAANWLGSNRIVLLNAAPQESVDPVASQHRLAASDAAELSALLDEFESILNRNSRSTARPLAAAPLVQIGPEAVDCDQLLRLGDQYRTKVATITHSANDSPKAGVNP